ncbi:unnamed protein product [Cuscuta campestris]|uniref:CCHC-type domain-containing protein n=1 Tax=Cuscuta campestris TaxID=132261 RepID=A0A484KZ37_9ASTE|nr:unnamed protein product [Cuscuta campestris]
MADERAPDPHHLPPYPLPVPSTYGTHATATGNTTAAAAKAGAVQPFFMVSTCLLQGFNPSQLLPPIETLLGNQFSGSSATGIDPALTAITAGLPPGLSSDPVVPGQPSDPSSSFMYSLPLQDTSGVPLTALDPFSQPLNVGHNVLASTARFSSCTPSVCENVSKENVSSMIDFLKIKVPLTAFIHFNWKNIDGAIIKGLVDSDYAMLHVPLSSFSQYKCMAVPGVIVVALIGPNGAAYGQPPAEEILKPITYPHFFQPLNLGSSLAKDITQEVLVSKVTVHDANDTVNEVFAMVSQLPPFSPPNVRMAKPPLAGHNEAMNMASHGTSTLHEAPVNTMGVATIAHANKSLKKNPSILGPSPSQPISQPRQAVTFAPTIAASKGHQGAPSRKLAATAPPSWYGSSCGSPSNTVMRTIQRTQNFLCTSRGQIQFNGQYPMRLFRWSPNFNVKTEPSIALVWVTFPNLRADLFNVSAITQLFKPIGRCLKVDLATTTFTRPDIAEAQVEDDLLKPTLEQIWIGFPDDPGEEDVGMLEIVEYECIPKYYTASFKQGHNNTSCNTFISSQPDERAVVVVPQPSTTAPMTTQPSRQRGSRSRGRRQREGKGIAIGDAGAGAGGSQREESQYVWREQTAKGSRPIEAVDLDGLGKGEGSSSSLQVFVPTSLHHSPNVVVPDASLIVYTVHATTPIPVVVEQSASLTLEPSVPPTRVEHGSVVVSLALSTSSPSLTVHVVHVPDPQPLKLALTVSNTFDALGELPGDSHEVCGFNTTASLVPYNSVGAGDNGYSSQTSDGSTGDHFEDPTYIARDLAPSGVSPAREAPTTRGEQKKKGIALKATSSDEDNEFGLVIKKFHKFMRKEYERKGKKQGGPPKCYGCGEVRHIKPKCPNAKNEKEKKLFKKHRAYISWGGDSVDESSEVEENALTFASWHTRNHRRDSLENIYLNNNDEVDNSKESQDEVVEPPVNEEQSQEEETPMPRA